MKWTRPKEIPIGQVWSRFKGREIDGKPPLMYQIRDMEETHREECLDMLLASFLRDEPLSNVLNLKGDPDAVKSTRANWQSLMDQGVCITCFTEVNGQPDKLVGVNILYVASKNDEPYDIDAVKSESWRKLLKTLTTAEGLVDVYSTYGVDHYMSSSGLTVLSECRGQNIGARMMAAREPMCKAMNIGATCTVFTAITSQVLAAKAGFELLAEMPYSDMLAHGVDLGNCTTKTAKVMGKKFRRDQN